MAILDCILERFSQAHFVLNLIFSFSIVATVEIVETKTFYLFFFFNLKKIEYWLSKLWYIQYLYRHRTYTRVKSNFISLFEIEWQRPYHILTDWKRREQNRSQLIINLQFDLIYVSFKSLLLLYYSFDFSSRLNYYFGWVAYLLWVLFALAAFKHIGPVIQIILLVWNF